MASDYAMVIVPAKKDVGKAVLEIQKRRVAEVPGPGDKELAWDTTLDPSEYNSNVDAAADIAALINMGKRFRSDRPAMMTHLAEAGDILGDLCDCDVRMSGSSRLALMTYVKDMISDMWQCVYAGKQKEE